MSVRKWVQYSLHTLIVLLSALLCIVLAGCDKKAGKIYRVGIISEVTTMDSIVDGFKARMSELGYVEGENIVYEVKVANFNSSEEQRILCKFKEEIVDLIFAFPTEAAVAAKTCTQGSDIPLVFAMSMIEGSNLVKSVRQPGGNITGVRDPGPDVTAKRLEIFHELLPKAKKIYINYDLTFPAIPPALAALRSAAALLGIDLVEANCNSLAAIKADLDRRRASRESDIDAVMTMGQPLTVRPEGFSLLSAFAAEHNIPIGGVNIKNDHSSLFVYETKFYEIGRLAAPLANKIFKGISAGTIPVVTPESYLKINYRVARELGLDVSEGLLARADEILR